MLQWMGGSRRKVTTSRKSTQNRQKQYFEQRKRQQQATGLENFHDAVHTGREHHKEHRSLDILSLLNLSVRPQENRTIGASEANTSTVPSNFMKIPAPALHNMDMLEESSEFVDKQWNSETGVPSCYEGVTSSPMKNIRNDYDNHKNTIKEVDFKSDPGKTSVEQNLSIFDLFGDDGMIGSSMASPVQEAHVAFSVEGLGRVEMETPPCSPQHTGRSFSYGISHHQKTAQPCNFSQKMNMLDDLELNMDVMMQNINKHHDASSFKYSVEMMDTCESSEKNSPAKIGFRSVEDCNRNTYYGRKSMFDGMDRGRDRWDGGFSFLDNDFLGEMDDNVFERNHSNRDYDSIDFLKHRKYDISENPFDSPYLPKKRVATRTIDEFSFFESAKSSLKHHTSTYDYDLTFDTERWNSRAPEFSKFEDKPLQPDWFGSVADNATDSFTLLSEESCSSSAVKGGSYKSTPLNTNIRQSMRRARDGDSCPGNSCTVDSIYSREPHCRLEDKANQRDHANRPVKFAQKLNPSKSKPVNYSNPPFMEKLEPSESWSFEKESNLSSFCHNPETDGPLRGFMPCTADPFPASSFPESSFTNKFKYDETDAHPRGLISEEFVFQPSNVDSKVTEWDLHPNSKSVRKHPDMAEATSSLRGNTISPLTSAQESIGEEEKGESKSPPFGSEKVDFLEETCIISKEVHKDDREWPDTSNYKMKNGDSLRSSVQNEPPAMENSEASNFSDHAEKAQPVAVKIPDDNGGADENKFSHKDEFSVPCTTKGEKEVDDFGLRGRKTGSKNCSLDSSSPVMMLESYVLQLLFVQKGTKAS